jgi:hypothetical protein
MHLRLEPQRAALKKRLFCEIFLRTGYFVLKFTIKVNFVKIVGIQRLEHGLVWEIGAWPGGGNTTYVRHC